MKRIVLASLVTVIALPAFSDEAPRNSKFQISKTYTLEKNTKKYESLSQRPKDMFQIYTDSDSYSKALTPICVRGKKLVEGITPLLRESKGYTYNLAYEMSYARPLRLNNKYSTYDVDCIFRGSKGEGDNNVKITATYKEKLVISYQDASITKTIKIR
jgi:hypothetical protein